MQGSVPTRADADKFVAKAAEVIGAENVIDQYVIDPAAPPASDGFIRVDVAGRRVDVGREQPLQRGRGLPARLVGEAGEGGALEVTPEELRRDRALLHGAS